MYRDAEVRRKAPWADRVKRLVEEAPPLDREVLQEIAVLLNMRVVDNNSPKKTAGHLIGIPQSERCNAKISTEGGY